MTKHLSPREIVEFVDGTLAPDRRTHTADCAYCAGEVASLQSFMADIKPEAAHGDVPEPSPLFWHHLSARVREAVDAEPVPRRTWWQVAWRPLVSVGALVAVTIAVAVLRPHPAAPVPAGSNIQADAASGLAAEDLGVTTDDASFDFVVQLAATLPSSDLRQMTPRADATSAMISNMTPAERTALARLIKARMEGAE
jgi:hypothetical protein